MQLVIFSSTWTMWLLLLPCFCLKCIKDIVVRPGAPMEQPIRITVAANLARWSPGGASLPYGSPRHRAPE